MDKCENCQFPSSLEMGKNLTFSFINVVGQAFKTGRILASKEIINNRMSLCLNCPYRKDSRCLECGCVLTLKVGLQAETCPRERW